LIRLAGLVLYQIAAPGETFQESARRALATRGKIEGLYPYVR
jgi:hypothetical protein